MWIGFSAGLAPCDNTLMRYKTLIMIISSAAFLAPLSASAAQINISIGDNLFQAPSVTINQGDTVVWKNNGTINHTVTADNSFFSSGTLAPGQSFSYTFSAPGTFRYYCAFHGAPGGVGMSGTVVVVQQVVQTQTTTSGSSAADLQAQVQALLNKVTQLQQQLGGAGTTAGSSGTTGATATAATCPNIGRVLKKGSSGADVSRLQQFLATDPSVYPEGTVSGYYGALTEAAVKRWQVKYNVVSSGTPETTGYGVVGPRTAAAIALLCSGGGGAGGLGATVGGFIQVSPIGGNAPLTVNVQATVNTTNSCVGTIYTLDWGDNTAPVQIPVSAGNCQQVSQPYTHIYQYGGNYLVTLSAGGHRTTAAVAVYGTSQTTNTNTNTNTNNTQTSSYGPLGVTPGVGGNPLQIGISFQLPSSCTGFDLSWGDGSASQSQADGGSSCAQGSVTKQFNHTYSNSGSYTITLKRGPGLSATDSASVIISN